MHNIPEYKLNLSFCLALIDTDKILESDEAFLYCYENLARVKVPRSERKAKEEELLNLRKIYVQRVLDKSNKYFDNQEWSKVIICYEIARKYNQGILDNVNLVKKFIRCLAETKQFDLARDMIEYLLELINNNIEDYPYIAEMYDVMKDNKNSVKYMEEYINSKNPDEIKAETFNICGIYYNKLYHDDNSNTDMIRKSLYYYESAHRKNPQSKQYMYNITIVAQFVNDYNLMKEYWSKMFNIGNLSNEQLFDYSLHSLKMGDIKEWTKYYKGRFNREDSKNSVIFPKINKPLLTGVDDAANSIVLVHYEQGFGDTIMMSGLINRLAKYAKKTIFVVQDQLYDLLNYSFPEIEVIPELNANLDNLEFDCYIPSMDLPRVLDLDRNTLAMDKGYLRVNQERVNHYKKYFDNSVFNIGISLQGDSRYNLHRNIPLEYLKLFENIEGVKLYFLNKDVLGEKNKNINNEKIIDISKYCNDFSDTAAVMENCDLIVSTDNVILNLAGAIGKKTMGLFNWYSEYRWFDLTGEDTVWYPSVKPFVNKKMNDWQPTIERVITEIKNIQAGL